MRNVADPLELRLVLEGLPGIISIINRFKSLEKHITSGNDVLDECIYSIKNTEKPMSPYSLTESEKNLARFGDRVEIIVGLAIGGKLDEKEAFNEIKLMYKDLKKSYKNQNADTDLLL